jgi:hypothetical protein
VALSAHAQTRMPEPGGQGEEGGRGSPVPVPTRARRNLSSAVHYWNDAAATISYLRDAMLVQLPTGDLAEERKGVGSRKGNTCTYVRMCHGRTRSSSNSTARAAERRLQSVWHTTMVA